MLWKNAYFVDFRCSLLDTISYSLPVSIELNHPISSILLLYYFKRDLSIFVKLKWNFLSFLFTCVLVDITPHLSNELFVVKLNDQLNNFGFGTL